MAGTVYGEVPPPLALADRVACLWWVRGAVPADGEATILPDGCADLVWHGGALTVAGPDTAARGTDGRAPGVTVGVRLRPGAATTFGVAASSLRDRHPTAEELWGADGRRLTERAGEVSDPRERLAILTAAVAAHARNAPPTDALVDRAVTALGRPASAGAGASVAAMADGAGISERQLRRRFHDHVGYGPKTLHRVLRLQRFLTLAIETDEALAGLAALAGFADQAHLARETRALAAATPAALVAARRPPAPPLPVVSETSKTPSARRARMPV